MEYISLIPWWNTCPLSPDGIYVTYPMVEYMSLLPWYTTCPLSSKMTFPLWIDTCRFSPDTLNIPYSRTHYVSLIIWHTTYPLSPDTLHAPSHRHCMSLISWGTTSPLSPANKYIVRPFIYVSVTNIYMTRKTINTSLWSCNNNIKKWK